MESQNIIALVGVVIGAVGFVYGVIKDRQNNKLNDEIRDIDNRIKANEMYDKIRNKREIFEEYMADLLCIDEGSTMSNRKSIFYKTSQKYTALFNEIEDFCTKIHHNALKSETYISETVLPVLSDLAEYQIKYYSALNDYAKKYDFDELRKPDHKAFDNFDRFLIKYNGGENGHFWRKLKNMRRDADFE